jgi:hypothetical protein
MYPSFSVNKVWRLKPSIAVIAAPFPSDIIDVTTNASSSSGGSHINSDSSESNGKWKTG